MKVEYEGGAIDFELVVVENIQSYHFPKMITTNWIKITFNEVYTTVNNGGSFKFWGKFHD
jgi:hypothetical protein